MLNSFKNEGSVAFKTTFLPASVKVNWGATKVECKSMSYIEYTYIYILCIIYII